jgi:hypothetical protein
MTRKRKLAIGIVGLLAAAVMLVLAAQVVNIEPPFALNPQGQPILPDEESELSADKAYLSLESGSVGDISSPVSRLFDQHIILTAHLELVVEDVTQSVERAFLIAERAGGFISSSSIRQYEEHTIASLTLRIPASAYQGTLSELKGLAEEVREENSSARDVGEEYTDLAARLRNLEATEAQYLSFMNRAKTIDEVLKVQNRLSEVRSEIERVKGRINYLDSQSEMATISLNLLPPPIVAADAGWDPLHIAQDAWEASMALWQGAAGYMIRVTVFLWWLPLPAGLAILLWRRWETRLRRPSLES